MKTVNPKTEHSIVNRVTTNFFRHNGWPSVAKDENGVLYAVASCFRAWHVCPFGKTAMFKSYNNGKTWTKPMIINDSFQDDRDAGILYMGNGKLLVSWFTDPPQSLLNEETNKLMRDKAPKPLYDAVVGMTESYKYLTPEQARGGSYVIISEDYGVTWTDPIRVPVSAPHGPTLKKDGSLIYVGKIYFEGDGFSVQSMCAFRSNDYGHSWEHLSTLAYPKNFVPTDFHEPHALELPNGNILCMIRTRDAESTLYQTESCDGGKTWSEMRPSGIIGYPAHLLQHSSGALISVYGRRCDPISQCAAISYDNGNTWTEEYIIATANDWDMGYPASVELDDSSIITVYYQKYEDDEYPSILCTRWYLNN